MKYISFAFRVIVSPGVFMVKNSHYMLDDATLLTFHICLQCASCSFNVLLFSFFRRLFLPHHLRAENRGLSLSLRRRGTFSAFQESGLAGSQLLVGSCGHSWHQKTTKETRTPQTLPEQMELHPLAHLAPSTATPLKTRSGTA